MKNSGGGIEILVGIFLALSQSCLVAGQLFVQDVVLKFKNLIFSFQLFNSNLHVFNFFFIVFLLFLEH
jgi:hypothetical protein